MAWRELRPHQLAERDGHVFLKTHLRVSKREPVTVCVEKTIRSLKNSPAKTYTKDSPRSPITAVRAQADRVCGLRGEFHLELQWWQCVCETPRETLGGSATIRL